jgi:hypothetical protein
MNFVAWCSLLKRSIAACVTGAFVTALLGGVVCYLCCLLFYFLVRLVPYFAVYGSVFSYLLEDFLSVPRPLFLSGAFFWLLRAVVLSPKADEFAQERDFSSLVRGMLLGCAVGCLAGQFCILFCLVSYDHFTIPIDRLDRFLQNIVEQDLYFGITPATTFFGSIFGGLLARREPVQKSKSTHHT